MVATLIIIRGNSASGKSKIAKQLQAELGGKYPSLISGLPS
ncbi:putative kinase [Streptococcus agalactiae]|nr:putative kinase [Streptococcus agalactiae]